MEREIVGPLVITEEDRTKKITVKDRGEYTLRYPNPIERATIAAITGQLLGGLSVQSVLPDDLERARVVATLSQVVTESPEWFDAQKCLDEALLVKLFGEFEKFVAAFKARLKKNSFTRASAMETGTGTASSSK